ncbi:hypothetical protein FBZ90_13511 [Nitrospirillum pindoramense]|uniref:Uncharacterized protein n=1 Tax=Nitrospirillum amazonense TaxID=28077 RepID=A0A560GHM2_9PROT|nr:hypothetical protein FBZ90_13511 [Nitrospirillum amazonense]
MAAAPPCRYNPRLYSFASQGTLVLGECPKDMEQELPVWRVRVHNTLRQGPERDASVAQAGYDVEQVGQRAAETVEFPHHQRIARLQEVEARLETGPIITRTGCLVLEQMAGVHSGSDQSIALQGLALTVILGRDAHVADQHVRKTPPKWFLRTLPFRHRFSCRKWQGAVGRDAVALPLSENRYFLAKGSRRGRQSNAPQAVYFPAIIITAVALGLSVYRSTSRISLVLT